MVELIEWDPVDALDAGAVGEPGSRTFLIQARRGAEVLSVLVEKEQVAILAAEAHEFLDRLAEDDPTEALEWAEPSGTAGEDAEAEDAESEGTVEEDVPLFRARLIGIGYDPDRRLVLLELREHTVEDGAMPPAVEDSEGYVARLYATRSQVRTMAEHGSLAADAGRPACSLCGFPMDAEGHRCPRWN